MIAIAASVALPPARRISAPAAAARGSAAETIGWARAVVEERTRAMRAMARCSIAPP
jgi:hypothetical protein